MDVLDLYPSPTAAALAVGTVTGALALLWAAPKRLVRGDLVITAAAFVAITCAFAFGEGWATLGLGAWIGLGSLLLQVLGLYVAVVATKALVVDLAAVKLLGMAPQEFEEADRHRNGARLARELPASVYASTAEEILFRGLLQGAVFTIAAALLPGLPALVASVAIVGLAFGLMHRAQGATGMLTATTVGLTFGTWYAANGGQLLPLILAHVLINIVTDVVLYFAPPAQRHRDARDGHR